MKKKVDFNDKQNIVCFPKSRVVNNHMYKCGDKQQKQKFSALGLMDVSENYLTLLKMCSNIDSLNVVD